MKLFIRLLVIVIIISLCLFLIFSYINEQKEKKQNAELAALLIKYEREKYAFSEKVHPAGKKVSVGKIDYYILKSFWLTNIKYKKLSSIRSGEYLVIHLSVENRGNSPVSIPKLMLQDSVGRVYESSSESWKLNNDLRRARINPSKIENGYLMFEVSPHIDYNLRVAAPIPDNDLSTLIKIEDEEATQQDKINALF